jgi:hypothetical protein
LRRGKGRGRGGNVGVEKDIAGSEPVEVDAVVAISLAHVGASIEVPAAATADAAKAARDTTNVW